MLIGLLILCASILNACQPVVEDEPITTRVELQPGNVNHQFAPAESQLPSHVPPSAVRFERLTSGDGLSNEQVRAILQDHQGYMWFATSDGLNRYDGYNFMVFSHDVNDPTSLRHNNIETIFEDRLGVLWAGTRDGWLERYDRKTGQFTHYLLPSVARIMHEDLSGNFLIGLDEPGLVLFNRESGELTSIWVGPSVREIFEDNDGVIWAGNQAGQLAQFDGNLDLASEYPIGNWIEEIQQDHHGRLWIGTIGGGLVRLDRDSGEMTRFQHDPENVHSVASNSVHRISFDPAGDIWVAAYRVGLDRYHPDTEQFIHYQHNPGDPHSLAGQLILDLFRDRSNTLWIGTELSGINLMTSGVMGISHFRHLPNNPNSLGRNAVTSLFEDDQGILWVGTRNGLDRFDRHSGQWKHYRHEANNPGSLINDYVGSVYQDRAGSLWVGTGGGLDMLEPESEQFVHYPALGVYGIYQDNSGEIWITAADGLYLVDRDAETLRPVDEDVLTKEDNYWTMEIHEDQEGMLWMGTATEGLWQYDPQENNWRSYQHDPGDPQSLSHNFVESIFEDDSGDLWIGTHGGLNHFRRESETFTHYRVSDGLPSDTVLGVLQDNAGYLWLSTLQGLSKFDPRTGTFRNYDADDGLQGNQFSRGAFFQNQSGEMFFGGNNGFNVFYPEEMTDNTVIPPIVISSFSNFNEVVQTNLAAGDPIELEYDENFLSFDFAALNFINPAKNQYAYRMEGVDEDWVYSGSRRHADYPNMRPGNYVFRVKGSNNDGVWNEQGTSVSITIKPPFWATWWFRGIIVLVLVIGLAAAYWMRVRSLQARSRDLEKQVLERTSELSETNLRLKEEIAEREKAELALAEKAAETAVVEERNRLARELHDAVTQTLFSASLIAEVLPRLWQRDPEEGDRRLQELRELSRGALAEMRTLLLELRPMSILETDMETLLTQLAESAAGRARIPIHVEIVDQGDIPPEVKMTLYRIAQESLNNLVKHAEAVQAWINFQNEGERIEMTIRDDGTGFEKSDLAADSLGLGIMLERAEAIGANLEVISEPDQGTSVRLIWEKADFSNEKDFVAHA